MSDEDAALSGMDQPRPEVDRKAAFAAGPSRIPRRFVYLVLAAAAVLGLGGVLAERLVSVLGLNPVATTTTLPRSHAPAPPVLEKEAVVPGALASFMGLDKMTPGLAAPFTLVNERGARFSLAAQRGRVVVLSFFDGRCDDICPVLASELERTDLDLGATAGRVSFVTVNTDPADLAVSGLQAAAATGLGHLTNWHMVTGTLQELQAVWRDYGITVNFDPSTRAVAHNQVIYILDPGGHFRFSATPFGDESRPSGRYRLDASEISEFAHGIATYAAQLVGSR